MPVRRLIAFLSLCLLLLAGGSLAVSTTQVSKPQVAGQAAVFAPYMPQAQTTGGTGGLQPVVRQAEHSDVSPPLRSVKPIAPQYDPSRQVETSSRLKTASGHVADPIVQKAFGPLVMPTPIQNIEAIPNLWGGYPPDTNGEVGPNNYVQQVNIGFQIWNKTGTSLYGPASFNTLFTGFGGGCETRNDGDPVVVYDQLADRWLLTQFTTAPPYKQCIAISTSGDPTGSYYRYAFAETTFEDYPHFGVWPDAYYMSANDSGSTHFAFEKSRMLVGDPTARMITFHLSSDSGLLPSDLDGYNPPPPGSPNYFLDWYNNSPGELALYKYHVDWSNTGNSTFTGPVIIPVADFDPNVGGIDQPGTSVRLDDLSDRLMYRVAYRNMGDHEVLLANHTVRDSTTTKAGVRWYELRNPGGTPVVYQQGTYAPDATNRWMGSVAMDNQGNIAVGFSASSSTIYPSIRYAGRLVSDPLGQMAQGENTLISGTGSQTGSVARWGDYSDITVDPTDDCTFWFTTEYIQVTGERTWRTRIGSFKFPSCSAGAPTATVTGTPPTITPTHSPTLTPTATPTLCPEGVSFTGSITNTDPTQPGRVAQFPPSSACDAPKSCASPSDTIPRHYKSYNYVNNTGAAECVTVILTESCSNNALWSVAYLNTFNPTVLCQNYLADGGRGGPVTTYSFTLPAGATAVVVVHEVSADLGCESFTLTINPCSTGGGATPTPTNTPQVPTVTVTPTSQATDTATDTPVPGATDTPTSVATDTDTPTSVAATDTPTSVAGTTETPTATAIPPTHTPVVCANPFSDVHPSDYFYDAVLYLSCNHVISGYADGTFRPYANTTRGQLSKIVVLAEGWTIDTHGGPHFSDVPAGSTFYPYIETAYNHSIISGYSDGTFKWGTDVTRGQLSKIVVGAEGWAIDTHGGPHFSDVPAGSTFYTYIETAYNHSIISGYADGTFHPGNNATRGQISKIVYNAVIAP